MNLFKRDCKMGIKKSVSLLSSRFEDNQKSWIPQPKSAVSTILELSRFLKSSKDAQIVHEQCPLCGGTDATIIAQKDRYGLPLDSQVCQKCGLLFSGKYFSPEFAADYYNHYSIAFKSVEKSPDELFRLRTAPDGYCWSRYNYVRKELGDAFDQIQTVIEVGCCDGANLYPYFKEGKKVHGCDFDEKRLKVGKKAGMDLHAGDFSALLEQGVKADLVILSHVIEHFGDLFHPIREIQKLLAPGGFLYVEVPGLLGCNRTRSQAISVDGYHSSNDFLPYLQLEHNYCFELKTLQAVVEKCGYKMLGGDEIVRSLFVIADPAETEVEKESVNRGEEVIQYLKQVEENYQQENPWYRQKLRTLYYWLKLHLKN